MLIAAHGNSLRALVKYLDNISEKDIVELNIPTGMPLVYELDENLKPLRPLLPGRPGESKGRHGSRGGAGEEEIAGSRARPGRPGFAPFPAYAKAALKSLMDFDMLAIGSPSGRYSMAMRPLYPVFRMALYILAKLSSPLPGSLRPGLSATWMSAT